jgi:tetratricopeptide (TPR) repeat protein
VNATCLLAQCLLDTGRPYEALTALQPALADQEPTKAQKVGLIYLTARAYETLGDLTEASRWYEEARAADPQYRDVEERARALKLKRKK